LSATAHLSLDRGGRLVTFDELKAVPCPTAPAGSRWRPVAHHDVLTQGLAALSASGYEVEGMHLAVSRADARFWGALTLKGTVAPGVSLAVLIASSLDRSVALRFGYGHRVWACQNGSWSAERTIARKHTTFAVDRYQEAIMKAVSELSGFREQEAERIRRMQNQAVTLEYGEAVLLRLYHDEGILSPRNLPVALKELRDPSFDEFKETMNAWRLLNAVTFALAPRAKSNPQAHAAATIRLGAILCPSE
jgi:hypothetical protein